jgi:hypothetical protein
LTRDSARVASRFVTVDFYFKLSSAPASWASLSALQARPEKRERGLEGVGQGPCKLLVAYCRRDEWVALISPEGLFGEFAPSLISRLGPEFQLYLRSWSFNATTPYQSSYTISILLLRTLRLWKRKRDLFSFGPSG